MERTCKVYLAHIIKFVSEGFVYILVKGENVCKRLFFSAGSLKVGNTWQRVFITVFSIFFKQHVTFITNI